MIQGANIHYIILSQKSSIFVSQLGFISIVTVQEGSLGAPLEASKGM